MRYLIEAKTADFRLHPACDPANYQISDTLRDVNQWRAKILVNNSGGADNHLGGWDEVGYVMISLKDNTIVPIARSDEHNTGFDLLYDMQMKSKELNASEFWSLFNGNNYVYEKRDLPKILIAITKWLSYGGPDGLLKGANGLSKMAITLTGFVAAKGNVEVAPGHLNQVGAEIVRELQAIAVALRAAREDEFNKRKAQTAFLAAKSLAQFLNRCKFGLPLDFAEVDLFAKDVAALQRDGNVSGLEDRVFGFHGIKNQIHNEVRAAIKVGDSYSFNKDKCISTFGDLSLAFDILGRF